MEQIKAHLFGKPDVLKPDVLEASRVKVKGVRVGLPRQTIEKATSHQEAGWNRNIWSTKNEQCDVGRRRCADTKGLQEERITNDGFFGSGSESSGDARDELDTMISRIPWTMAMDTWKMPVLGLAGAS
jgi:hypothetical protein